MTTNEQLIEIIKAYNEGKTIMYTNPNWKIVQWYKMEKGHKSCAWNMEYNYKIEEPNFIRPYENVVDLFDDMKNHGPMVKDGRTYRSISKVTKNEDGSLAITLAGMQTHCYELVLRQDLEWQDGTPFGITGE